MGNKNQEKVKGDPSGWTAVGRKGVAGGGLTCRGLGLGLFLPGRSFFLSLGSSLLSDLGLKGQLAGTVLPAVLSVLLAVREL